MDHSRTATSTSTNGNNGATVQIPRTEDRSGVTYYVLELADLPTLNSSTSATVARRYSELAVTHAALVSAHPTHAHLLTGYFPPKSLFQQRPAVVAARQRALAQYLSRALSTPPFATSPVLADALGVTVSDLERLASASTGGQGGGIVSARMTWYMRFQEAQARVIDLRKAVRDLETGAGGARAATAARTDADEVLEEIRALEDALASDAGAGTAPVSAKERMRRSNLLLSERQTVLALRTRLATAADAYSALGGVAIPAADGAAYNVSGSPMLAGTTPSSARRVLLSRPTASGTRPPATAVPGSFSGSPRPTYASAAGAVGSPIRGTAPSGTDYVATDNAGLVLMQRETLGAQEQAVGVLGTIAARLKHQAYAIGDEVDVQNEMLDDLGGQMDRVEAKVKAGEKKARKLAGGR